VDLLVELVDAGTSVLAVTHDEDFVRALGAEVLALGTPSERGRAARTAPAAEGAPAVPAVRSAAAAGSATAAPAAPGAGAVRVVPARREPVR
jgi:energy-coupling factor transport system ATP-binding protein